jgi:hypothetical protein
MAMLHPDVEHHTATVNGVRLHYVTWTRHSKRPATASTR